MSFHAEYTVIQCDRYARESKRLHKFGEIWRILYYEEAV